MNRRTFIGGLAAAGLLPLGAADGRKPLKFLLMSDTHVESDFLERGRPVYTCWKTGDYASLVKTYEFINEDPFCRDAQFALFCGDQVNTGYAAQQNFLEDEMKIYWRTLQALDLHGKAKGTDLSSFKFRARPYTCRENVRKGQSFDVVPPPLTSRVIAIQGNHDTGCPAFYRECAFQCGGVRFITFFASYVGLNAPPGKYRSTAKIDDAALAFVEREMKAAAADPEIRHIVLACHWSIVKDDPKNFRWPLLDGHVENGVVINDNRNKLLALCEKYGCDLYLHGHEHNGTWPSGRTGCVTDVNCGTVTAAPEMSASDRESGGAFAIVEMSDDKAVFHVYSRAAVAERDGACVVTAPPRRLFVREISLKPIK